MKKFLLIAFSALFLWNCEDTDLLDPTGELVVTDFNLPELTDAGYIYEGWLLVGGTYVSVGTISKDSITNNRAHFRGIETSDLSLAESFAITVENGSSPAPSNYVLLVGDFNGSSAELTADGTTINGITTLGNKISAAYTLQNATVTPEVPGTFTENGIWFFKGEGAFAEPTISLIYGELRYQAWLETTIEGVVRHLNMGIIGADAERDSRNEYTPQNPSLIPNFAGEDFLRKAPGETIPDEFFPMNVKGKKIILTPVFSGFAPVNNKPFPIYLFQSQIPTNVSNDVNVTYPMELNTNFGAKATKI